MLRNKFRFQTISNVIQIDWDELKMSMREFDDGEIIVRKRIEWNTDQMRNYLHGPVLNFLRCQLRELGIVFTKEECKTWVKGEFLDKGEVNGVTFLKSTASLCRDEYTQLLKDINEFCMDRFGCGLPEPDKVD